MWRQLLEHVSLGALHGSPVPAGSSPSLPQPQQKKNKQNNVLNQNRFEGDPLSNSCICFPVCCLAARVIFAAPNDTLHLSQTFWTRIVQQWPLLAKRKFVWSKPLPHTKSEQIRQNSTKNMNSDKPPPGAHLQLPRLLCARPWLCPQFPFKH